MTIYDEMKVIFEFSTDKIQELGKKNISSSNFFLNFVFLDQGNRYSFNTLKTWVCFFICDKTLKQEVLWVMSACKTPLF